VGINNNLTKGDTMKQWNKKLLDNVAKFEDAKLSAEVFKDDSSDLLLALAKVNLLDDAKTKQQISYALYHTTWNGHRRESIGNIMPKHWHTRRRNNVLNRFIEEAEALGADFSHRWSADEREQIKISGTFK
jgi:hypothetical protein